jgi:hypothetical protein
VRRVVLASYFSFLNVGPLHCHSDARSASVIDDRIRPALEAGNAMGSTKPVLVVIDEIDGATGDNVSVQRRSGACLIQRIQKQGGTNAGFISKLIGLTMDPPKKKSACLGLCHNITILAHLPGLDDDGRCLRRTVS